MMEHSAGRVAANTATDVNIDITQQIRLNIDWYSAHPTAIPQRLKELDREWDVERALAAGSSTLSILGLAFGFSGRKRWFFLPAVVQGFYMQHTLQGWCPPLPLLRRMGFRTPAEIEWERCALKEALRDDNAMMTGTRQNADADADTDDGRMTLIVEEFVRLP